MKYSEAEKKIKDLLEAKYGDERSDHYRIEDGDLAFGLANRYNSSEPFKNILMVSKRKSGWLEVEYLDRREKGLADIFMELALTPLDEREEEKNYVIKILGGDNPYIIVKSLGTDNFKIMSVKELKQQVDEPAFRVAFSKAEIGQMKDIITLNLDWSKAVEEYNGEI